jgi:ATP-binding cassette, subfamily F, member 1
MLTQKRREQQKDFENQEKKIREMKASGQSTKQAESKQINLHAARRTSWRSSLSCASALDDDAPKNLLKKLKDYIVKFKFPEPKELAPPILGLKDVSFCYNEQAPLFKKLQFGIDMSSRVAIIGECREMDFEYTPILENVHKQ